MTEQSEADELQLLLKNNEADDGSFWLHGGNPLQAPTTTPLAFISAPKPLAWAVAPSFPSSPKSAILAQIGTLVGFFPARQNVLGESGCIHNYRCSENFQVFAVT